MSRFSNIGSCGAVGSMVAVLAIVMVPTAAMAKNPSKGVSGIQVGNPMGNQPISKNVGNLPIKNIGKIGSDPISKTPLKKPIGKIGSDPLSKTPKKLPLLNPIDPAFCHHDFFCHPHWHWSFFPLVVDTCVVECVYDEPLYTLYYETADGVKVFSRYELPAESATLYKTEHALDKSVTSWWLVNPANQLVDTNTDDKAATVTAAAAE